MIPITRPPAGWQWSGDTPSLGRPYSSSSFGRPLPFWEFPPPSPSIPIEGLPLAVRAAVLGFCGTPAKTDAAVARYAAPKERCYSASARTQSVRLGQQLLYGQRADCPDGCRVTVS